MEIMQGLTTVGTGVSVNVLSGQLYERMPFLGDIRLLATADATGDGRATLYAGGRVLMAESPLSRQARFPIDPDDLLLPSARVGAGQQLVLQARAAGAGTSIFYWRILLKRAMGR